MPDDDLRRLALDATTDGVLAAAADPGFPIVYANAGFARLTGYTVDEVLGRNCRFLQGEGTDPAAVARISRALAGAEPCRLVLRNFRKDGTPFWNELALSPVRDGEGRCTHVIGILSDVSARVESREALERLARHDELTGLPTRAVLLERADRALRRLERHPAVVGILFLDVDALKEINDAHGHDAGDAVLVELRTRFGGALRATETLARLGGDEFIVLCEDLTADADATRIARRLVDALAEPIVLETTALDVTVSIGVVSTDDPHADVDDLVRAADAAMYRAKRAGGGRWALADAADAAATAERLRHEAELPGALEREELTVRYQPIVTLEGFILGVEALVRWQHPREGLLGPAAFLPAAESAGLGPALGAWVLDRACADAAGWVRALGGRPFEVSVNLSALDFADPALPDRVRHALAKHGLDPACLGLEIKEDFLGRSAPAQRERLDALRATGVRLVLDGFGDGGMGVRTLGRLEFDRVKIHRSFVADLGREEKLLSALLALGRSLELPSVVEGVETEAQAEEIARLGVRLAQGFFYAEPVTADAVPGLVRP